MQRDVPDVGHPEVPLDRLLGCALSGPSHGSTQRLFHRNADPVEPSGDAPGLGGYPVLLDERVLDGGVLHLVERPDLVPHPLEAASRVRQPPHLLPRHLRLPRRPLLQQERHRLGRPRQPPVPHHPGPETDGVHRLRVPSAILPVQRTHHRDRPGPRFVRRLVPPDTSVRLPLDDEALGVDVKGLK